LTSHFHIAHKCTAFRCEGELVEISADELAERNNRNHYMAVMKSGVTKTLRAREHTASLSQEIRQEIEQNFAAKKINLLSCTTTMEMGVDLGDLEAVACLNIPPGISNYQQRTGRAGRRAQAAPFCVTLAKNSRYDQAVFNEFCDYLASPAHVPCIHLANAQLFQRHQYSVLLSGFLLHRIQDLSKNAPSLAMFLGEQHDEENHLKFIDSLQCWLESEKGLQYLSEATALKSFLPTENGNIGLAGQTLIKAFVATMERFSQTCCDRWSTLNQKKKERLADNDLSGAARWERQQKKFMGQLLVTRLSCHGIIPTYSFPVHSLSLEVIKEQKKTGYFGSADIELSRNAALGISEYSPGCRIVANGRIWTSAGLAYSPRQFMPEQVFLVCPECNHVETNLSKDDLASECPFCGNEKRGRVTSYIEPLGFVTDYKERSGANPGQVRPRRMYADEARLISQARDDDFHLTNHPNILKALLPAVGAKGVEAGRLFIVNKGPNGWGFHRCSLCNRMEPAKFQGAIKVEHTDIRSGKKCGSRWMSAPICLAHEFTTDIAIFRFTTSLPIPKQKAGSQFFADQKNMATTLSEAMRFAASEILHVKDSEIRGSFKIRNGYADILLYDDVPGGAGYAQKLQDVSIQTFLQKTMERLICPDNCSTACRKCLCDYSNQNKWPRFNRKPVLRWLKSLVGQKKSSRFLGAEPWPDNSLAGIDSRLVNFRTIHITGTSLVSSETDPEGPGMRWLLSHLHEGRTVHCHLSTSTPYRPSGFTSSERRCWNKLRDAIQHEKIVLSTLDIKDLPRIFPDVSIGVPAFYSEYAVGAFLDNPLPKPAFISILDDSQSGQISKQLKASIVHASTIADDLQPRVIQLIAGQKRDIKNIFSPLDDAYLRSISVFDPYCGTKNNIESTEKFLTKIDDIIKKCEKINIHCKEINYKDFNYEFPHQTEVKLNEIFDKLKKIDKLSAKIVPFLQGKKFHDRWIICEIYLNDGSTMKHRFDLSGGIDLLLDESKSTKVYHYIDKNIH
jgi:hypothetical protein